jgi:hypothetical protein
MESFARDIRSVSIDSKRFRDRQRKYYNFRAVKPGQSNQPHIITKSTYVPYRTISVLPMVYSSAKDFPKVGPVDSCDWIEIIPGLKKNEFFNMAKEGKRYRKGERMSCSCCRGIYSRWRDGKRKKFRTGIECGNWRDDWDYFRMVDIEWELLRFYDDMVCSCCGVDQEAPERPFKLGALVDEAERRWEEREMSEVEKLGWMDNAWSDTSWSLGSDWSDADSDSDSESLVFV